MLGTTAIVLLCLLPSQVNALTALAKCLPGFEWMFSSIGQSPCDITVEVAQVCYSVSFVLSPINGTYYTGPHLGYGSICLCNSVYYSLLSACAYCQGGSIRLWSDHSSNCTRTYIGYPQQITPGVKVPAYAYLDVTIGDRFNVTLASLMTGRIESSRAPPSSTQTATPTPASSLTSSAANSSSSSTTTAVAKTSVSPGAVGGVVVGGLVVVGLIASLITFLVLRSKQKSRSQNYDSFRHSPNMGISPGTTGALNYSPNRQSTYPSDIDDPYRQYSPPLSPTPQFTGNGSTLYDAALLQTTGRARGYSGVPEL